MNVSKYLRGEDRHVGTARTVQPLAQSQKQWRNLTRKERDWLICTEFHGDLDRLIRAAIAKFKKKQIG